MDVEATTNTRVLAAVGRGGVLHADIVRATGLSREQADCVLRGLVDARLLAQHLGRFYPPHLLPRIPDEPAHGPGCRDSEAMRARAHIRWKQQERIRLDRATKAAKREACERQRAQREAHYLAILGRWRAGETAAEIAPTYGITAKALADELRAARKWWARRGRA